MTPIAPSKISTRQRPQPAKPSERTRTSASELQIEGKRVRVSNLEKVFYPKAGFTKGQVIDYYVRIAPVLLPHLQGRPVTMKRFPNGVEGQFFYEKRCPVHRPEWVDTASVWSKTNQAEIDFCVLNTLPTLVWAANLADLELHTYLAKATDMQCPTVIVFDLDPGPPANILHCLQVGFWLKEKLDRLNLQSFPKTSGSKGLQVYIPLNTPTRYEVTKPFAKQIATMLETEHPDLVVSKMDKILRRGKVLVDWSQNDDFKTTICVYSLRAKERPTVSTPVSWDELESARRKKAPEKLVFESSQVLKRVEKLGDLFAPVLQLKQKVPS